MGRPTRPHTGWPMRAGAILRPVGARRTRIRNCVHGFRVGRLRRAAAPPRGYHPRPRWGRKNSAGDSRAETYGNLAPVPPGWGRKIGPGAERLGRCEKRILAPVSAPDGAERSASTLQDCWRWCEKRFSHQFGWSSGAARLREVLREGILAPVPPGWGRKIGQHIARRLEMVREKILAPVRLVLRRCETAGGCARRDSRTGAGHADTAAAPGTGAKRKATADTAVAQGLRTPNSGER